MKFKRNDKRKVRAVVEMTPLIDVVFQLLIFFMLSATFVVQTSIPIEVPEAQGAESFEQSELTLTLQYGTGGPDGEGRIFVNEIEIADWGELTRFMSDFAQRQPESLVLVRPDTNIPTGRTVMVLGILTSAGVQQYAIAAQPPEAE